MSLKVPEVEKFYKLPDSRAVVEFRINTGFTASCFFGTLLVAFAQIKDFYISVRCSATIVSTCPETPLLMSCVNGNLSFIFDVNRNISFTPNLVGIKILLIRPAVVELLCHIAETFA